MATKTNELKEFWIDLDGTLVNTPNNNYVYSTPIKNAIDEINRLYEEGHKIVIWTGRGSKSGIDWRDVTLKQLKTFGIKYTHLRFDKKPDFILDDIAVPMENWLSQKDTREDVLAGMIADTAVLGSKILICGNGGLESEANHFKTELIGKFAFEVYIPCIAFDGNTAIANDMGFENIFAHQVKVLGNEDDVFIGMTTSHSQNIVKAITEAHKKGLTTVVLCGEKFTDFTADYVFEFKGKDTAEIQENMLKFLHKVAYKAKEKLI